MYVNIIAFHIEPVFTGKTISRTYFMIYITNWNLILGLVYHIIDTIILIQAYVDDDDHFDLETMEISRDLEERKR